MPQYILARYPVDTDTGLPTRGLKTVLGLSGMTRRSAAQTAGNLCKSLSQLTPRDAEQLSDNGRAYHYELIRRGLLHDTVLSSCSIVWVKSQAHIAVLLP